MWTEHGPANILISELWENKFLLDEAIQFVIICYGSPRKLMCMSSNIYITANKMKVQSIIRKNQG